MALEQHGQRRGALGNGSSTAPSSSQRFLVFSPLCFRRLIKKPPGAKGPGASDEQPIGASPSLPSWSRDGCGIWIKSSRHLPQPAIRAAARDAGVGRAFCRAEIHTRALAQGNRSPINAEPPAVPQPLHSDQLQLSPAPAAALPKHLQPPGFISGINCHLKYPFSARPGPILGSFG